MVARRLGRERRRAGPQRASVTRPVAAASREGPATRSGRVNYRTADVQRSSLGAARGGSAGGEQLVDLTNGRCHALDHAHLDELFHLVSCGEA